MYPGSTTTKKNERKIVAFYNRDALNNDVLQYFFFVNNEVNMFFIFIFMNHHSIWPFVYCLYNKSVYFFLRFLFLSFFLF